MKKRKRRLRKMRSKFALLPIWSLAYGLVHVLIFSLYGMEYAQLKIFTFLC